MKCSAVKWIASFSFVLALGAFAALAQAGDRLSREAAKGFETVEMFKAMAGGDVEVSIIPKDATEATVIFTNKSKKPLALAVPEAFVAVPVAPQFGGMGGMGGMGMGGMGMGGMGGMGGMQGFGGGMGMMGGMGGMGMGGMGGMGGFGGFMNVEAAGTRKIKIKGVCLEHGKEDPSPRVKYAIKPIESFTDKTEVYEVCKMLARGEISQNVAQAAAWHAMDGLSWNKLAAKNRVESKLTGYRERWFAPQELIIANRALAVAHQRAESLAKSLASNKVASQDTFSQD